MPQIHLILTQIGDVDVKTGTQTVDREELQILKNGKLDHSVQCRGTEMTEWFAERGATFHRIIGFRDDWRDFAVLGLNETQTLEAYIRWKGV
jgi:hypothetical protein